MKKQYFGVRLLPHAGYATNMRTLEIDIFRWNIMINVGVSIVNHQMFEDAAREDEENRRRWDNEGTPDDRALFDTLRPYTTATDEHLKGVILNLRDED